MQLDITANAIPRAMRLTPSHRVGIEAQLCHVLRQGAAGIRAHNIERGFRQDAERRLRADVGIGKPRAFLGANGHDRHIARRFEARALPRRQDCDAGNHAGGAIEISALRHGIQMRRDQECPFCRIAPVQRHVEIAGDIGRYGKARQAAGLRDQVMR
jgi:hypothetical protein